MSAEAKYRIKAKDETKGALKSVKGNLGGIGKTLGSLKGSLLGVFGVAGMGYLIKSTLGQISAAARDMDDLAKASKRVGMASEDLDAWTYAAQLAGSSSTGLQGGLKKLSITMYDVTRGSAESIAAFKELGVDAVDSSGKLRSMTSVLFDIADRMQKQKNATLKAALAQRLLGRGGMELIPMLNQGSEAIKNQLVEANLLGLRYDDLTGDAEELIDAQLRWTRSLRTLKDVIATEVMPGLTALANTLAFSLIGALSDTDEEFRAWVARRVLEGEKGLEALNKRRDELLRESFEIQDKYKDQVGSRDEGFFDQVLRGLRPTQVVKDLFPSKELEEARERLAEINPELLGIEKAIRAMTAAAGEQNDELDEMNDLLAEITGTYDEHIKSHEAYNKLLDEGRKLTLASRTAKEVYKDTLDDLKFRFKEGTISLEVYTYHIEKAGDAFEAATRSTDDFADGLGDVVNTARTLQEELEAISDAAGRQLADSFIDAITDVENAFEHLGNFASNILRQIASAILTHNIFDPIFAALPYGGGTSTPPAGGEIASSIIFNVNAIDAASFNNHIAQRQTRELITGIVRESAQRSGRGSRL